MGNARRAEDVVARLYPQIHRRLEALQQNPVALTLPPLPRMELRLGEWVGLDVLKSWAGFGAKRGVKGKVSVNVRRVWKDEDDVNPVPPAPEMVAAYAYLKANERAVTAAVLEAFKAHINDERHGWRGWLGPIDDVKQFKPMMKIGSVHLLHVAKQGMGYVGLFFHCTWDEEHAAGALLHGSRVITVGDNEACGDELAALDDGGRHIKGWSNFKPSMRKTRATSRKKR